MVSILFFSLTFIIGSSLAFLTTDVKYPKHPLHRISRNNEQQQRVVRSIMGRLIDTETNTIYNLDGQKQQGFAGGSASAVSANRYLEDLACLEACYKCVEDYPLATRKKKAADNCGPMCDCADSCSRLPIEEVDKLYGQGASTRGDKTCFWKTYTQSVNGELPALQ